MRRWEAAEPPGQEGVLLCPGARGPQGAPASTSSNLVFILSLIIVQKLLNFKRLFTVGKVGPVTGAGGKKVLH